MTIFQRSIPPPRRPPGRGLLGASTCAVLAAVACGGDEPAPGERGQPIPLGAIALTVSEMEPVPSPPPVPLNTLRAAEGLRPVVVFLSWEGLDDLAEPDRFRFVEKLLEDRLTLTDAAGNEYRALSSMTRPMYSSGDTRGMIGGTVPHDWVAVFHVDGEARDFALLIENPDPRAREPKLTRVDLGSLDAS